MGLHSAARIRTSHSCTVVSYFVSVFHSVIQSVACQSIKYGRHCRMFSHTVIQTVLGFTHSHSDSVRCYFLWHLYSYK
jgi:hypothetical protein